MSDFGAARGIRVLVETPPCKRLSSQAWHLTTDAAWQPEGDFLRVVSLRQPRLAQHLSWCFKKSSLILGGTRRTRPGDADRVELK